jgi:hypothetical protein
MKIFRVENESREGPYATLGQSEIHFAENSETFFLRCPMPKNVGTLSSNHLFGFESLDQLKDWFNIFEREYMYSKDLVCSVIEVPEENVTFCATGKQIVFDNDYAKRINFYELTEI